MRRLLGWFTQPVPAGAALDPHAYIAHILTNVSQLACGRRLLMHPERGYLSALLPQLTDVDTMDDALRVADEASWTRFASVLPAARR